MWSLGSPIWYGHHKFELSITNCGYLILSSIIILFFSFASKLTLSKVIFIKFPTSINTFTFINLFSQFLIYKTKDIFDLLSSMILVIGKIFEIVGILYGINSISTGCHIPILLSGASGFQSTKLMAKSVSLYAFPDHWLWGLAILKAI